MLNGFLMEDCTHSPSNEEHRFAARPKAFRVGSDAWVLCAGRRTQRVSSRRQTTTTAVDLVVCSTLCTHSKSDTPLWKLCFELRKFTAENAIGSKYEAQNLNHTGNNVSAFDSLFLFFRTTEVLVLTGPTLTAVTKAAFEGHTEPQGRHIQYSVYTTNSTYLVHTATLRIRVCFSYFVQKSHPSELFATRYL